MVKGSPSTDPAVFLSSTGLDLKEYRRAALEVCRQLRLHVVAMEDFEAMGSGASAGSLARLEEADVYVGIYAHRYGYIEPPHTKSVTELEFEAAGERRLERLCFLVDPEHPWLPKWVDRGKSGEGLEAFKSRIDATLIRARFTTVDDFRHKLYRALEAWLRRRRKGAGALAALAQGWEAHPAALDYLSGLWEKLPPVQTLGAGRSEDLELWEVYTQLDVTARLGLPGGRLGGPDEAALAEGGDAVSAEAAGLGLRGEADYLETLEARLRAEAEAAKKAKQIRDVHAYRRSATAVEAVAAAPRLVLLGPGGSGKSTFAKHLALCLAGEVLGHPQASLRHLNATAGSEEVDPRPWPHGRRLPVWVELRSFVRHPAFPGEETQGEADHLLAYLESLSSAEGFGALGREALLARPSPVVLLLDGLDETPAAAAHRERLRQVVAGFARKYPQCRILVTSRPYAYEPGSPWRLDAAGFEEATLAPFDAAKIESFVRAWYGRLQARGHVRGGQAERQVESLCREIGETPYLQPLAERPLMLTMMAGVHFEGGGRLRGGRAGLYARSVELLLDRWNELRDMLGGQSLPEHLGLDAETLLQTIEELAYRVHKDRGEEGEGPAEISSEELWQSLEAACTAAKAEGVDQQKVLDYLQERSGILVGLDGERYSFPHRSYQEYLAASYLTRERFPDLLLEETQADPTLWREVVLFAAGRVAATPYAAWALLEGLVPEPPPRSLSRRDPRFLLVLYAALALREQGLWQKVQARDRPKLARLRRWLERTLTLGPLSARDRAQAGQVLALLGDRRDGVGSGKGGLPKIRWCRVASGPFLYGEGASQKTLELPDFEISRMPVTNLQYEPFVAAGGYEAAGERFWSKEGLAWREKEKVEGPWPGSRPVFALPNHPRIGVNFWEAEAYCAWLAEASSKAVRLPTEEEWEKAARGEGGRVYPWGNSWEASRCNSRESELGMTTAVGMYPQGKSPCGALDLAGNVWEWTGSLYSGGPLRVFRGGGWAYGRRICRAAYRNPDRPAGRIEDLGFRLVRT